MWKQRFNRTQGLVLAGLAAALLTCGWQLVSLSGAAAVARIATVTFLGVAFSRCCATRSPLVRTLVAGAHACLLLGLAAHGSTPAEQVAAWPWVSLALGISLLAACRNTSAFDEHSPNVQDNALAAVKVAAPPLTILLAAEPIFSEVDHEELPEILSSEVDLHNESLPQLTEDSEVAGREPGGSLEFRRDQNGLAAEGTVPLIPGQRQAYLHVPFIPGFATAPQIWCETEDGEAMVETDRIWPFGVRLRVRRNRNVDSLLIVRVSIFAASQSAETRAA